MTLVYICLFAASIVIIATFAVLLFGIAKRHFLVQDFIRSSNKMLLPQRCLLIRPCSGDEEYLVKCLTSISQAKHDFHIDIVFGVDDIQDSAMPAIRKATSDLSAIGYKTSFTIADITGANRKASIIDSCIKQYQGEYDVVIVADSNIDLTGFDLNKMLAFLMSSQILASVWVPFFEKAEHVELGNKASEAVLHFSWHSFGLLSCIDKQSMVGKLFALKREAVNAIDGFGALSNYLGEDMELCRRLAKQGYNVKSIPLSVMSPCSTKTWKQALDRHVRWMTVVKAQRPLLMTSYPLLFFNSLIVYAISIICAVFHFPAAAAIFATALVLRFAVGYVAAQMLNLKHSKLELIKSIFLADTLIAVAFVKTIFTKKIIWRGKTLIIGGRGNVENYRTN